MDKETLAAYNANAQRFAEQYRAIDPVALRRQLQAFFHPNQLTADVGCGSGRDTAWLAEQGYDAVGFDASPAMLDQARRAYPGLAFEQASLPDLRDIEDGEFDNLLCSATLMHLGREHLITAVLNMARILRPGGRMVVTCRASRDGEERETDGRLFTAIPTGRLVLLFEASGLEVVQILHQADTTRPGVEWIVLLAEKSPFAGVRGLERVQTVLAQDKKDATYKFALIRALCSISRTQAHVVAWEGGKVYVPLWSIAVLWLEYYWPLLTHRPFVAQKRGEHEGCKRPIAFRDTINGLASQFATGGIYALLRAINESPSLYRRELRKIAETIRQGPVTYSGTQIGRIFSHEDALPSGRSGGPDGMCGWVVVPESVWLDITRFSHWIEDSLILRWADLTREMNEAASAAPYIPLLLESITDEHDTKEVRSLLIGLGKPMECVWSGATLSQKFEVDHVIPHSAWGNNDWWNLLPAVPELNNRKRDSLPTRRLLWKRRESIIDYWRVYRKHRPAHFERQVSRALGVAAGERNWDLLAFAGLQETVERVAATRGLGRWEP